MTTLLTRKLAVLLTLVAVATASNSAHAQNFTSYSGGRNQSYGNGWQTLVGDALRNTIGGGGYGGDRLGTAVSIDRPAGQCNNNPGGSSSYTPPFTVPSLPPAVTCPPNNTPSECPPQYEPPRFEPPRYEPPRNNPPSFVPPTTSWKPPCPTPQQQCQPPSYQTPPSTWQKQYGKSKPSQNSYY